MTIPCEAHLQYDIHYFQTCLSFYSCRPVGGAFTYGLVLPWALIHLLLCLVLLLLPCLCFFGTFRKHATSSRVREYTGVFLAIFLFNIGWGFGLPATHPLHIGSLRFYAQIVFVVANGSIGLVLLFFFCIMSKNVRQTYSIVVILRLLKRSSGDWQKKSRLYKSSKEVNEIKVVETKEEVVKEEEDFDLNEVHGNPAVVDDSTSETQFN